MTTNGHILMSVISLCAFTGCLMLIISVGRKGFWREILAKDSTDTDARKALREIYAVQGAGVLLLAIAAVTFWAGYDIITKVPEPQYTTRVKLTISF